MAVMMTYLALFVGSIACVSGFLINQKVCYRPLGCFRSNDPFNNALGETPDSPDDIKVKVYLWTKQNPLTAQLLDYQDTNTIAGSNFDSGRPTKILIHGFMSSKDASPAIANLSVALLKTYGNAGKVYAREALKMADREDGERCSYQCFYCAFNEQDRDCFFHPYEEHPDKVLKLKNQELSSKTGKLGYRTLNFNVIPNILKLRNKRINNEISKTEQALPHINYIQNKAKQIFSMKMSCKELKQFDQDKPIFLKGRISIRISTSSDFGFSDLYLDDNNDMPSGSLLFENRRTLTLHKIASVSFPKEIEDIETVSDTFEYSLVMMIPQQGKTRICYLHYKNVFPQ